MKSSGTRALSFLSGIFFGILAALGLVFLLLNDFNPVRFFSDSSPVTSCDTVVILSSGKSKRTKSPDEPMKVTDKTENSSYPDSISVTPDKFADTLKTILAEYQPEIVVKRDELLDTKQVELIQIAKVNRLNTSDSLLRNFQGEPNNRPEYRIEFWKSPVNFKGFKFIRNAVITYGLDPTESIKLYELNEKRYLKYGAQVYRLYITDKFEPFTRITDEQLIKQLK